MTRTTHASLTPASRWFRSLLMVVAPALILACGADGRLGAIGEAGDGGGLPPAPSASSPDTTSNADAGGDCQDGQEGCSCRRPGDVAACGVVHFTSGVYSGCDPGASRCLEGMKWGPCYATGLPMPATATGSAP